MHGWMHSFLTRVIACLLGQEVGFAKYSTGLPRTFVAALIIENPCVVVETSIAVVLLALRKKNYRAWHVK
jgi:hypothetical protein